MVFSADATLMTVDTRAKSTYELIGVELRFLSNEPA